MGKVAHPMDVTLGGQGSRMLVGALWSCWGWDSLGTAALPGLSAHCSLVGWNQSAGGSEVPWTTLFPRL